MQQVNLGMIGGGTVGSGVFHALQLNGGLMASRIGVKVVVRKVAVKAFNEPRPYKIPRSLMTTDWRSVVNDSQVDIVIELVGGTTIAFFSNHPSGGKAVMTAHVDALKAEAGKYTHVIAVGDYNFTAREPYFASLSQLLEDSATQLGEAKLNCHGATPNLAGEIDHIFVSHNFRVLESHYLAPPDSETDHPAHWSVLRME